MGTLRDRMQKVIDELKSLPDYDRMRAYKKVEFIKSKRSGDYLIKVGKNNKRNWYGEDRQYIDCTYQDIGYFVLGPRKNAQWFTGKEAFEFMKGKKGFTIVKR